MTRLAAGLLWLAWCAIASAGLVIRWLHADPLLVRELPFQAVMLVFATTGAALAIARPRNPIGWLLIASALLNAQDRLGAAVVADLPELITASLPVAVAVALGVTLNNFLVFPLIMLILLTFPDGTLLSPRWRAACIGLLVFFTGGALLNLLAAGPIRRGAAEVAKPFGVEALAPIATIVFYAGLPAGILGILAGAASLFRRYRSAGSVQRQQVKWMAASASLIALYFLTVFVTEIVITFLPGVLDRAITRSIMSVWQVVVPLSLPLAIAAAILRYRLYDIDLLINRTLVYGALSAALAATYFGAVALLQTALRPLTGGSELAVAGSTLAVVALAAPLRRRIQGTVDRRFYRSRYDAARTLDAFGARLRDEVDLDSVRADLLDVVHETVRPAHASVWLRKSGR